MRDNTIGYKAVTFQGSNHKPDEERVERPVRLYFYMYYSRPSHKQRRVKKLAESQHCINGIGYRGKHIIIEYLYKSHEERLKHWNQMPKEVRPFLYLRELKI